MICFSVFTRAHGRRGAFMFFVFEHGYFRPLDTWRTFWFFLRQTLSTYRMGLIQNALVEAMSGAPQKIFSSNLDVF